MSSSSKRRRSSGSRRRHSADKVLRYLGPAVAGFVAGVAVMWVYGAMPRSGLTIVTKPSAFGFEQTVEAVQNAATDRGFVVVGAWSANTFLTNQGGPPLARQVTVVRLAKVADVARQLAIAGEGGCMMPQSIVVWEDDEKKAQVSHLDAGSVGKFVGSGAAAAEQLVFDTVAAKKAGAK